jgi:hypothetical protein
MASGVPAYIASSLTNIYTPPASTMALELTHIHVVNTSATPCWFSLYIGGTGAGVAGTEWFKFYNVDGYKTYDYWTNRKMISTNFLVGIAQTASVLTIDVEAYQYVL